MMVRIKFGVVVLLVHVDVSKATCRRPMTSASTCATRKESREEMRSFVPSAQARASSALIRAIASPPFSYASACWSGRRGFLGRRRNRRLLSRSCVRGVGRGRLFRGWACGSSSGSLFSLQLGDLLPQGLDLGIALVVGLLGLRVALLQNSGVPEFDHLLLGEARDLHARLERDVGISAATTDPDLVDCVVRLGCHQRLLTRSRS